MDKIQSQTESLKISASSLSADLSDDDDDLSIDSTLGDDGDEDLSDELLGTVSGPAGPLDFNVQKEEFEKQFIIKALKTFKGKINQTALHANIPKKTLLRKIEKYGIVAKDYAESKLEQ